MLSTKSGAHMRDTFEVWMAKVTLAMEKRYGMSPLDIPDYDYYNAYATFDAPYTTARRAIRAAQEF